jgi:hypothetical protein
MQMVLFTMGFYEWDYRHGRVEGYDKRGRHIGEFDPATARRLKGPNPDYKVEV